MRLITLGLGAALGYFLGSREGRKNLEKMSQNAQKFWNDPKTQEKVHEVQETAAAKWEEAKNSDTVKEAADKVTSKVDEVKAKVSGDDVPGKSDRPQVKTTASDRGADPDVVSDPATSMSAEGPSNS
ncbi:MAG: YtxH domain-containing protein [Micrococcus sp.]|nr:YtxH domain-containing protein [Micrococcus sp.]